MHRLAGIFTAFVILCGSALSPVLAQDKSHTVALVDLDLALGDADVMLDLMGDHTLADVALNIDRLDMTFLKRSLARHASGLSLLPHPVRMRDMILRVHFNAADALEMNREFQSYLTHFGETQKIALEILEKLAAGVPEHS